MCNKANNQIKANTPSCPPSPSPWSWSWPLLCVRNGDRPGEVIADFRDDRLCRNYMCGFCPADKFENTKACDGPCDKVHDDKMKAAYEEARKTRDYGFERDFERELSRIVSDVDKKIAVRFCLPTPHPTHTPTPPVWRRRLGVLGCVFASLIGAFVLRPQHHTTPVVYNTRALVAPPCPPPPLATKPVMLCVGHKLFFAVLCFQRQYDRLRESDDGVAPTLNLEKSEEIIALSNEVDTKTAVRRYERRRVSL